MMRINCRRENEQRRQCKSSLNLGEEREVEQLRRHRRSKKVVMLKKKVAAVILRHLNRQLLRIRENKQREEEEERLKKSHLKMSSKKKKKIMMMKWKKLSRLLSHLLREREVDSQLLSRLLQCRIRRVNNSRNNSKKKKKMRIAVMSRIVITLKKRKCRKLLEHVVDRVDNK